MAPRDTARGAVGGTLHGNGCIRIDIVDHDGSASSVQHSRAPRSNTSSVRGRWWIDH
jgi:hypothetical protein